MQNIIEQVYYFNQEAGLLGKGYSDELESAFQIEEALEGFDTTVLYNELRMEQIGAYSNIDKSNCHKEVARTIVKDATSPYYISRDSEELRTQNPLSDVDRLDKACDAIVFAIGSMAKLGLTPSQIEEALYIVTSANLQKLDMPKDDHGKLTKPADFVGPEIKLQELLDQRR